MLIRRPGRRFQTTVEKVDSYGSIEDSLDRNNIIKEKNSYNQMGINCFLHPLQPLKIEGS